MNFFRKLHSPVALIVEGFLAGALLFTAVNPSVLSGDSAKADARAAATVQALIR
jgi:hypothetical protein